MFDRAPHDSCMISVVDARGVAAVALAALAVACSSSTSGGGELSGSSGGGGRVPLRVDGGGGQSHDAGAAADYDASIAACSGQASEAERVACCEQQIPGGYLSMQEAEQDCLCGSNGHCTSACTAEDCANRQSSSASCQSCLDTNVAGTCETLGLAACAANPACRAYQTCVNGG